MQKVTLIDSHLIAHYGTHAPARATRGAAAWDLYAEALIFDDMPQPFDAPTVIPLQPQRCITLDTRVRLEWSAEAQRYLPYADVRLRSGHRGRGLSLNGDGIIDCDYDGTIVLKVWNVSHAPVDIDTTKPLAQMLVCATPFFDRIPPVATLRGAGNAGGFGSTSRRPKPDLPAHAPLTCAVIHCDMLLLQQGSVFTCPIHGGEYQRL